VLTEVAVMIQYIADLRPEAGLAPPQGTMERYRLQERINFIATELHKGMSPLYNTLANDDFKTSLRNRLERRWQTLADSLRECSIMGTYTVADSYAFYVLRAWLHAHKQDLTRWPLLVDYYAHLAKRPAVMAALASEGLKA